MGEVIELEDYKPHITVECDDDTVRVIPLSSINRVATGEEDLCTLEDTVIRAIIRDYAIFLVEISEDN